MPRSLSFDGTMSGRGTIAVEGEHDYDAETSAAEPGDPGEGRRGPSSFKIFHDDRAIVGVYSCQTAMPGGDVRVLVKVPIAPLKAAVGKYLKAKYADSAGWDWSSFKQTLEAITKKVGARKIIAETARITNDPRVEKGMALASTVYPPLGITYASVKAASTLLDGALAGDPDAVAEVKRLNAKATKGDAAAAKKILAMRALRRAREAGAADGADADAVLEGVRRKRHWVTEHGKGGQITGGHWVYEDVGTPTGKIKVRDKSGIRAKRPGVTVSVPARPLIQAPEARRAAQAPATPAQAWAQARAAVAQGYENPAYAYAQQVIDPQTGQPVRSYVGTPYDMGGPLGMGPGVGVGPDDGSAYAPAGGAGTPDEGLEPSFDEDAPPPLTGDQTLSDEEFEAAKASVEGEADADVGGWLYHQPYRGNLEARELDVFGPWYQRNPAHVMRALYAQGLASMSK